MSDKPTISNFVRAFRPTWFAAMSGSFSVPFAFAAALVDNKYIQIVLLAMAFGGAWFASYQVWKGERQKVCDLECRFVDFINEYAHSLRLERVDLEEERRLHKDTGELEERRVRFAIRFRNTISRPISYHIQRLVLDEIEQTNLLTNGAVISALSDTTFYTESKEIDMSDLDRLIQANIEVTISYVHPDSNSRVMMKIIKLDCYPKSKYTRMLYEKETDEPM